MAEHPSRAPDRRGAVRDSRSNLRALMGGLGSAQAAASRGPTRRVSDAFCAAPTAARSRGRAGSRRRPARRDPAPARTRQPWHHQHLPAGHRQQRDHQHRPRNTITDDLSHRHPPDEALGQRPPGRPRPTPTGSTAYPRLAKAGPAAHPGGQTCSRIGAGISLLERDQRVTRAPRGQVRPRRGAQRAPARRLSRRHPPDAARCLERGR